MILGIDTGIATCGWALLDPKRCSFEDLGVVIQPKLKADTVSIDRARRGNVQAQVLADKAPGCTLVVVEEMSLGVPGSLAKLSIGLSWGVILGIVAMMEPRPELLSIPPKRWQREVMPHTGKKVDYEELARAAAAYILRNHPKAAKALKAIDPSHRQHAIDAAMIALCGFLRRDKCKAVPEGKVA